MKLGSKIQIAGCVWLFLGSVFIAFAENEMKVSRELFLFIYYFSAFISSIIIMLGFRANRVLIDGQKYRFVDILKVFKFFTLPQILVAVGMLSISCAFLLGIKYKSLAFLLFAVSCVSIYVAIVRAIVKLYNRNKKPKEQTVSAHISPRPTKNTSYAHKEKARTVPSDDQVFLFTFGDRADLENYISEYLNVYLNANNGELKVISFCDRDPFSMRAGSCSSYEYIISYEKLAKILERDDVKDKSKYLTLTQDNWKQWLADNNYR